MTVTVAAASVATAQPIATARVYEEEAGPALAVEIERSLAEVLVPDGRLQFRPYVDILNPKSKIEAQQAEVADLLKRADAAWEELNVQVCKDLLDQAIAIESKILESRVEHPDGLKMMYDLLLRSARTRFLDADQRGARENLRQLFAMHGSLQASLFPPQMKKVVVEARLLFETLGTGSLQVESDPPGAEVYLDGVRQTGRTPLELKDLIPGPHVVTFSRRGYQPSTAIGDVRGGGETSQLFHTLERYPKSPLQPLDRVRQKLDIAEGEPTPTELKEAAIGFGVDVLFLVRLVRREDENGAPRPVLIGYGYDQRANYVFVRVERPAADTTLMEQSRALAQELVAEVKADGAYTPPKPVKGKGKKQKAKPGDKPVASDGTPLWKKKEFWYIAGGAAGVVLLSTFIGIGVGVTQQNERKQRAIDTAILGGL